MAPETREFKRQLAKRQNDRIVVRLRKCKRMKISQIMPSEDLIMLGSRKCSSEIALRGFSASKLFRQLAERLNYLVNLENLPDQKPGRRLPAKYIIRQNTQKREAIIDEWISVIRENSTWEVQGTKPSRERSYESWLEEILTPTEVSDLALLHAHVDNKL